MDKKMSIIKWLLLVLLTIAITFIFIHYIILFIGIMVKNNISYQVNAIDYISMITSAIVTIWVGWFISKKLTENRFQKEFLIGDLKEIERNIHEIEDIFETSTSVDIMHISSKFSTLYSIENRFSETISIMNLSKNISTNIREVITNLYEKATDFSSPNEYTNKLDIPEIKKRCNDIIIETRTLIIKINSI